MSRPFDPEAYRKFDASGKWFVALHLSATDRWVQILENYRYDIKCLTLDKESGLYLMDFHEVESRTKWHGGPWQYPDISIPIRKKKLVDDPTVKPLTFWCLSSTNTEAYTVNSELVNDSQLKVRFVQGREEWFYHIPVHNWEHHQLKGG